MGDTLQKATNVATEGHQHATCSRRPMGDTPLQTVANIRRHKDEVVVDDPQSYVAETEAGVKLAHFVF